MKPFLLTLFIILSIRKGLAVECGGFSSKSSGWLSAPKEDNDSMYVSNADCLWLLEVFESKAIQIQFLEMNIEEDMVCEYDYIKIDDGLTPKIYHCGTELPQDFISDTRKVVVRFISDDSIRRTGFNLTYTHVEDPTCGYRTWRGVGRFGSFDTDMIPGICKWVIQGPRKYMALKVFVTKLNITQSEDCESEYVEIYDDYEVFGRYCEYETMTVITTTANALFVALKLDESIGSVFEAYYATTGLHGSCGDIMTYSSGNISSYDGDLDGKYDNNQNCVWTILAPSDKIIRLEFLAFELEGSQCEYDYVQVFEGLHDGLSWNPFDKYCGDNIPPVTWTSSNVLTVHFVADYLMNKRGFNAIYTHDDPRRLVCEEILTQPSGFIHSIDLDNDGKYDTRQACVWTLLAEKGQRIYLRFLEFQIEYTASCNFDFVEIREGSDDNFGESVSIGKYCGWAKPPVIWSTSNVLMVLFISDFANTYRGFKATYRFYRVYAEDCQEVLAQSPGFFHSPDEDNAGTYEFNQDCLWTLIAPKDQVIYLWFLEFDIEFKDDCAYDFLEIQEVFDGKIEESVNIGKYCGDEKPPAIWSTSNSLVAHFVSDSLKTGRGFYALYRFYNATIKDNSTKMGSTEKIVETTEVMVESTYKTTTEDLGECDERIKEPMGFIHSPDLDNDGEYETYQNCLFTIIAPEFQVIYLMFLEFDIEFSHDCGYDFVDIREGFDGEYWGAVSIGKYCGTEMPPVIWSTSNALVLHFYSDSGITGRGFNATYRFYNATDRDSFITSATTGIQENRTATDRDNTEQMLETTTVYQSRCEEVLHEPSGFISSPDDDNDGQYEINQDCHWTLWALGGGQKIYFEFLEFDLEYSYLCVWDFVEIKEVWHGEKVSIGKYCGAVLPPVIWSTWNVLLVLFHSDTYGTAGGFNATYKFYNATDETTTQSMVENTYKTTADYEEICGEFLTQSSGSLHSPDEDNDGKYENEMECRWTLTAPEYQVIYLKFLEFDTEYILNCDFDFVEVFDGEFGESNRVGKFCGNQLPPVIWSTSNVLVIAFYSDEYITAAGFNATYRFYDATERGIVTTVESTTDKLLESTFKSSTEYKHIDMCGEVLTQPSGFIHSPQTNDGKYKQLVICIWTLRAPEGQVIHLKFLEFDIRSSMSCYHAYVEIREVSHVEAGENVILGTYCGMLSPPVIWSASNVLEVEFFSGFSRTAQGFNATYRFYDAADRDSFIGESGETT